MKYLLAVWDGGGATPPNLGVARMLVERGHEVVALGDPTLAADISATGAEHREWTTAPQRVSTALEDDVLKDWEPRSPIGQFARVRDRLIAGPAALFAADVIVALDDAAGSDSPFDAVLADGVLLGALIAAEARGVPAVALCSSVYLVPSRVRPPAGRIAPARGPLGRLRDRAGYHLANVMWRTGLAPVNAARATYGLAPLRHLWDQWDRADRVLVLTASAFDDPPPAAANVRYVGPVLEDLSADGVAALPVGDSSLVLVGLSSSHMQQAELLGRIARALATLPVRALVTTGPAVDPVEVPSASNVVVVRTAAHSEVLLQAALVITHAGHGTLIKAIAAGVPALCLPLGRDQPDNAARAARHGVALVLSTKADEAAIADAVRRMLDEPSYRAAVSALSVRVQAEIASGALLAELESVGATARPRGHP
jgi:MGT family glycosyltransferase